MSRPGGALTETAAKKLIALQFPNSCGPCWPLPKFRGPQDTGVSGKRGIAIKNALLSLTSLQNLRNVVSWGYGWDYQTVPAPPSVQHWDDMGIRWLPMVWGRRQLDAASNQVGILQWGTVRQAILGFNEPNFQAQANLSPAEAARLWPRVQQLAAQYGITKLVSPAVNFNNQGLNGIEWLRQFLALCVDCKVDAIAFHDYTCYGQYLQNHLDQYRTLGKKMWITEIACADPDPNSASRLPATGQMQYMLEAIPLLELDPDVEMYAWFSFFRDQWGNGGIGGVTGDAGLVRSDGTLSDLGNLYASLK